MVTSVENAIIGLPADFPAPRRTCRTSLANTGPSISAAPAPSSAWAAWPAPSGVERSSSIISVMYGAAKFVDRQLRGIAHRNADRARGRRSGSAAGSFRHATGPVPSASPTGGPPVGSAARRAGPAANGIVRSEPVELQPASVNASPPPSMARLVTARLAAGLRSGQTSSTSPLVCSRPKSPGERVGPMIARSACDSAHPLPLNGNCGILTCGWLCPRASSMRSGIAARYAIARVTHEQSSHLGQ